MSLISIATERLDLRPVKESDADAMAAFYADPEIIRYIPWPKRNREEINQAVRVATTRTSFEKEEDYLVLAIVRRSDDQLVGQVNAMYRSEANMMAEIGYVVNPLFARQGYGSEATKGLIDALFATEKFHRIEARLDDRNLSSKALLERLGFRLEAHFLQDDFFKGEWTNTLVYAMLRSEWKTQP